MKFNIALIFLLFLSPIASTCLADISLVGALLEVKNASVTSLIFGEINRETIVQGSPSCEVVKYRIQTVQKQIEEREWLIEQAMKHKHPLNPNDVLELNELRKRMVNINQLLVSDWSKVTVLFKLKSLTSQDNDQIQKNLYSVDFDLSGQIWHRDQPEISPYVKLTKSPEEIRLQFVLKAQEDCFAETPIRLSLKLQ